MLAKREVDRIFCQPFIEKIVQEPAQYDSYYQSKDDRSRYAHDIDVMAKEKISIYGRINDNGQCEDKTYLFSLSLFFISSWSASYLESFRAKDIVDIPDSCNKEIDSYHVSC